MTAEGNVLLIASFKFFSKVAGIVVVLIGGLVLAASPKRSRRGPAGLPHFAVG